jgi:hypothetical protein
MTATLKTLAMSFIALSLTATASETAEKRTEVNPKDVREKTEVTQQKPMDQRQQRPETPPEQAPQNCSEMASSYLEVLVPDALANVYLQGQLMASSQGTQRSFVIPQVELCKDYIYNVIVTWQDRAQAYNLVVKANQMQQVLVQPVGAP